MSFICSTSSCSPLLVWFETASGQAISKSSYDAAPNGLNGLNLHLMDAVEATAESESVSSKQYCSSSDALHGVYAVVF